MILFLRKSSFINKDIFAMSYEQYFMDHKLWSILNGPYRKAIDYGHRLLNELEKFFGIVGAGI